ncbi:MAG: YggU family protein [Candidatus Tectomicrobia bacterium]|uniref:UPF0235 protein HYY65_01705 n=1 Tax=Tectimicrobiota bacterium TaxID=2528274 RepID=A0A932GMY0_UNCTE|nr:YggU family protein [Candidatus Tectomicrobia bacterium]
MGIEPLPVVEDEGGVAFPIHVQPRSSRSEVVGVSGEFLKVRVCAPPVEGVANEECLRILAKWLHVPRAAVAIVAGGKSRRKRVRVEGLNRAQLMACLARVPHD